MDVFVGQIPDSLDAASIENFIYALVRRECHLNPTSAPGVAAVPVNKGFFFKRIVPKRGPVFGIITFARVRVAQWFIEYAKRQRFVINRGLIIKEGESIPSKTFVQAIADMPRISSHRQVENSRTAYTLCRLCTPQGVITVKVNDSQLSFLPRDVRAIGRGENDGVPFVLFELRQNPVLDGDDFTPTPSKHYFQLPSRVVRVACSSEPRYIAAARRLSTYLESLLAGVIDIGSRKIRIDEDRNGPFLARFFQQSDKLGIELAFLRESLLRNELVGTSALAKLEVHLDKLIRRGQHALAVRVLRNLMPKLDARKERGVTEELEHKYTQGLWDQANAEAVSNEANGLLSFFEPSLGSEDNLLSPFLHIDVTPTRVLLSGPHYHMSNRVIRSYPGHWHHFARVTFTNESREGATTITPSYGFDQSEDFILGRVLGILKDGITVAGRHWKLLAWSSSSMSTHTVWFMTPFHDVHGHWITADVIRNSLGNFKDKDVIKSPALYGARLSQAFSATASTIKIAKQHMKPLPDIKTDNDDNQNHTDGVGQISPALLADVWESYVSMHGEHRKRKLLKASAPSAIQIRLGGSKGMLAVNPTLSGKVLGLRRSMLKFDSGHQDLEVANSSSRCLPARLNRPLINALEDRGVSVEAFTEIQDEAIRQIGRARSKLDETARLCSAYGLGTGCNLRTLFEKCHKAGLGAASVDSGSFFLELARAIVAAALGDMKRKARIPVKKVTLLGIADEFGYLKEGEIFVQVETADFGEVRRRILTGRKLIGRSPTIDPGDITMVECRKPPPGHPLLLLRNVIVFNTCTRKQPLPRRLGGGDLDGDLVTVYEDERLFLPTRQPEGVFHRKIPPKQLLHDCHPHDLAEFFADFMLNDFIGLVSHLHLRIADASERGSYDYRCKDLARLHSQATDFRKTGVAVMRDELPQMREPIVPDFLVQSNEKREGKLTYKSTRVLGYMYRAVSWHVTDTPSLDQNTDPETGLELVTNANLFMDNDDEESEFGNEFDSHAGEDPQVTGCSVRATVGNGSTANAAPLPRIGMQTPLISRISSASNPGSADVGHASTTVGAGPWQFKDTTFPQLLQKIYWMNEDFLPPSRDNGMPKDDDSVTAEGHRYVSMFQGFVRGLREKSRQIASYHPHPEKLKHNTNGVDGIYLVSEVHLLTGRLPWASVSKRTRTDRDNNLLDSMQSICTLLRKSLSKVSEDHAARRTPSVVADREIAGAAADVAQSTCSSGSEPIRQDAQRVNPESKRQVAHRSIGATSLLTRIAGDGSAAAPYEVDSSEDETASDPESRRSTTSRQQERRSPLASIINRATVESNGAKQSVPAEACSGLKRKASREIDDEYRRDRSCTPTPLHLASIDTNEPRDAAGRLDQSSATPTAPDRVGVEDLPTPTEADLATPIASRPPSPPAPMPSATQQGLQDDFIRFGVEDDNTTVADEDEAEEGEITVASAQKTVDSLWKACHFFCSPERPRYSNVYGYKTFMITLVLHMLSMLETLKHLHRAQGGRRYYQRPREATPTPRDSEVETEEEDGLEGCEEEEYEREEEYSYDENYSLTEDAMRALDLGQAILADMAPNQLGFDG